MIFCGSRFEARRHRRRSAAGLGSEGLMSSSMFFPAPHVHATSPLKMRLLDADDNFSLGRERP
jgi:hypothetical protein